MAAPLVWFNEKFSQHDWIYHQTGVQISVYIHIKIDTPENTTKDSKRLRNKCV
jgi:hypothetical protein